MLSEPASYLLALLRLFWMLYSPNTSELFYVSLLWTPYSLSLFLAAFCSACCLLWVLYNVSSSSLKLNSAAFLGLMLPDHCKPSELCRTKKKVDSEYLASAFTPYLFYGGKKIQKSILKHLCWDHFSIIYPTAKNWKLNMLT